MKDEFTTVMHFELFDGRVSREEFMVAAVYGAINRGMTKEEACTTYGITTDFYDKNVERVINDPSW